ncbi:MAG: hypothetical protein WDA27_02675 [Actinomycetota bacterium]
MIEEAGIATVSITMMPDMARRAGVPRALGVDMPFGHTCGHARNSDEQTAIVAAALSLLESASGPETVVDLDKPRWEGDADWHPPEPSPIIAALKEQRRREAELRRSGSP